MKTGQELYNEHMTRTKKAIKLEKTDRIPVIPMADTFYARANGVKLADFASNIDLTNETILKGAKLIGDIDGIDCSYVCPCIFGMGFYSNMKLPGRELADDVLWQIDEREVMTTDDYDTIINKGLEEFQNNYFATRINVDFQAFEEMIAKGSQFDQNARDAGYLLYANLFTAHPVDCLSGGRTMAKFMMDIRRMPEKVDAVMDIIADANIKLVKESLEYAVDPLTVFMAMGRACPDFYNPKLWERFIWKYLKKITDAMIEMGLVVSFHIDSNWERGLDYFKDFPKGTCVFETDGTTDIYKIKEKLGNRMCIKGDVQAAKLTLGTPDEVYNYSTQLIKDMGTGFILSSGCSVPTNAKLENVKAMVAAATGK